MGGKHKQAQRTKNNARPSSSGRSAELLGSSISQFVGFSTIKENILSGFSLSTDDIDSTMDTNFQLVLKKMNKKDATTKLKALQEFTELIKTTDAEAMKAVLPFWPRLYSFLVTDVDHKVREATHLAHHQVVLKSKRNLAPFLKQFAGPWFTSQYDTYAPAASAASKSFQDAFPKNKIQDAIIYCQEEILSYIFDNVIIHTVQTLSNPKMISSEDAEAKFQRVVISSLRGYALYFQQLSKEHIEKQTDLNLKIISDSKFWKFAKHKVPAIQAAWFCVLTSLCHKYPNFLENETGHVVSAVFSNCDQNDPIVVQSIWEALLSILTVIDQWWKYVNVEKLVLPKLWKLLQEGGYGNASVIYPNLLPLISRLPQSTDSHSTYCLFFENMFKGMKHQNAISSRQESLAIATAYIECLRYMIMKNQSDIPFCEKLIRIYLLPVLEWNITDTQTSCKAFFNQIAKVVQYWSKNSNNLNFPNYSKYLLFFWNNLNSLFQGLLLNLELIYDKDILTQYSSRQMELLLSLKHVVSNKHAKVSFSGDGVLQGPSSMDDNIFSIDKSYTESLSNVVYNTCITYVKFVSDKHNKELVNCLVSLIQDFDCQSFFSHLNAEFGGGDVKENFIHIYRALLSNWLNDKLICSKSVVELVFLIFVYLKPEEKLEILNGFINLNNNKCFGWCIAQALSHPYKEDATIHTWLRNDEVSQFLCDIVDKELTDTCTADLSLILKSAFMEKADGELYLTSTTVNRIVGKLIQPLLKPNDYPMTLDTCASYAAFVSAIIYTTNNKLTFGDDLLLAMFSLSCSLNVDPEILSKDTVWEINTAWQDVIYILVQELSWKEIENVIVKCANLINKTVFQCTNENDTEQIIDVIVNFLKCMDANPLRMCDVLKLLLKCDHVELCIKNLTNACISAEYIMGRMCSPFEPLILQEPVDLEKSDIIQYCTWMHLMAQVLAKPWMAHDNGDDEFEEEVQLVINKVSVADISDIILQLIDFLTLSTSFCQHYPSARNYKAISCKFNIVLEKVKCLMECMDTDSLQVIENELKAKVFDNNWMSLKTYYLYCSEIANKKLHKECLLLLNKCDNLKLTFLHVTQIFAKHFSFEQVCNKSSSIENVIILRELIHCDELEVPITEAFAQISKVKLEKKSEFYLIESNTKNINWNQIEFVIECMRLYSAILRNKNKCISSGQRDIIILSFVGWSANITNIKNKIDNLQMKALFTAFADLFVSLSEYISSCDQQDVVNEWKDIFAQGVHKDFVEMWMNISGCYLDTTTEVQISNLPFLQEFGKIIGHLEYTFLFKNKHPNSRKWSKLLERSCSLLVHPCYILQFWGYHMIKTLVPGLVEVDLESVTTNTPHVKGLIFEQFNVELHTIEDIVQSILLDFKLGEDSCRIEPYTDSYTYTTAYLLLWDILLSHCEYASTELQYQYADWLKNTHFLSNLLDNVYKLMPIEIMHCTEGNTKHLSKLFTTPFSTSSIDACSSEHIEHMVCWIYYSALLQLPALVRHWWSQKEPRVSQIVEKVTASFVSPLICNKELTDIINNETKFKNMVVKVHPSIKEVVAVYTVDESQMELVIALKNNYPLTSPDIQCNQKIGGTSHKQWLLQLRMSILHQNGRIWDGLSLWNNNLDKKFNGVEECYICFAVLHQGTYQLPKLSCHTCKKKFHSACLYKWFSTSNKSTCPICRNLF